MDRDRDRRVVPVFLSQALSLEIGFKEGPRDRDIPPEDQYGTGRGQSYRPSNVRDRTPPRMDVYRARSPPRRSDYIDSYTSDAYRGPPRGRSRTPPPRRDDYRRRSPTPPRFRDRDLRGGDSYRGRPRSPPPRREDLPRDDLFRREPARDDRDYRDQRDLRDERDRGYGPAPRSPPRYRDRSPMPLKRVRDPSPMSSRGRRTPPLKRERLASPPRGRYDDYPPSRGVSPPRRRFTPDMRDRRQTPPRTAVRDHRPRSRSPPLRNDRIESRPGDEWRRPRSPLREPRSDHPSREQSAHASAATSRRSSPPLHLARSNPQQQQQQQQQNKQQPPPLEDRVLSGRPSPREPCESREQIREPVRGPAPSHQVTTVDSDRNMPVKPEPIPTVRDPSRLEDSPAAPRPPPAGPGGYRAPSSSTPSAPPTGPAAATRAPVVPPSGPRGAPALRGDFAQRGRGGAGADFVPRGRGGFGAPFRGGRGGAPPNGPSSTRSDSFGQDSSFSARGPPSGPRASILPVQPPIQPPSFRTSTNATATTYPRSQRFAPNGDPLPDNPPTGPKASRRPTESSIIPIASSSNHHPSHHLSNGGGAGGGGNSIHRTHSALADLPKIVEGGARAEPVIDRSKLHKLEAEAEKLRRQIEEKEARKRRTLREWERMTHDVEAAALRNELAEEALKKLSGETESQAAF